MLEIRSVCLDVAYLSSIKLSDSNDLRSKNTEILRLEGYRPDTELTRLLAQWIDLISKYRLHLVAAVGNRVLV